MVTIHSRLEIFRNEKKDLIESKKMILRSKEMICLNEIKFVWFKQSIFEPSKYLFESNEFFFKSKKLMHWYIVKDIICLIWGRNLFDSNKYLFGPKIFCLNRTNFVSFKQIISLHQRKSFKQIIFLIQSNIFSECAVKILKIRKIIWNFNIGYSNVWYNL